MGGSPLPLHLFKFRQGSQHPCLKTLPFKLLDLVLDPDGRFVLIHALIHNLLWVLLGLYLPPPAGTVPLRKCNTDV